MADNGTQSSKTAPSKTDGFAVTGWIHAVGGFVARHPNLWKRLGNFDTRMAGAAVDDLHIEAPIYVTGLARSGSTILLEMLAEHADTASHQYRDYPFILTPWLWQRYLERVPNQQETAAERTHADGIKVTSRSPEAFEEVLWMAFFPTTHDNASSSVLDRSDMHPAFERFYADHIRKLLAIRGSRRYLAKGNYNISRLAYLRRLFDDARFIIPVRDPIWHIASLMKQQRLFSAGETAHPKALSHMQRVGHFEFGLDRRAINMGDGDATADIEACWNNGDEVTGWARYWALAHNHIADRLATDPDLNAAAKVVRYEDLCQSPHEQLRQVFEHCGLAIDGSQLDAMAERIHFPSYYEPGFSDEERAVIERETAAAARRFGYGETVAKTGA